MKERHELPGYPNCHYVESEGGSGYYLILADGAFLRISDGQPMLFATVKELTEAAAKWG